MNHDRYWNPHRVMWRAIGGSLALLGALLALGWDQGAWTAAAGTLLVACVLVCVFAALQSRTTDRDVRRAVAGLVAAREADRRGRMTRRGTGDAR